jgi:hypothetical protein
MNKTQNRPALRFRNATVNQQINTCERFAIGMTKLPPEKRGRIPVDELQQVLEEAVAVRAELAEYRLQARFSLSKQKQVMTRLREKATACADWVNAQVARRFHSFAQGRAPVGKIQACSGRASTRANESACHARALGLVPWHVPLLVLRGLPGRKVGERTLGSIA